MNSLESKNNVLLFMHTNDLSSWSFLHSTCCTRHQKCTFPFAFKLFHIKTQHAFFCPSTTETSLGWVNFFFGSSNELFLSLLVFLVSIWFAVVSLEIFWVAGALVALCNASWVVVALGVYFVSTTWEESLTSSGETAFEALISFAVV